MLSHNFILMCLDLTEATKARYTVANGLFTVAYTDESHNALPTTNRRVARGEFSFLEVDECLKRKARERRERLGL